MRVSTIIILLNRIIRDVANRLLDAYGNTKQESEDMRVAVFSTKSYDRQFLNEANKKHNHELIFFEPHLSPTTCKLAFGFEAVCVFVNDQLNKEILTSLTQHGTKLIALRCAGFNNVDVPLADDLKMTVVRVPAYSAHGVAEHAVTLILTLNRKVCRAYNRIHDGNFSLEGLLV